MPRVLNLRSFLGGSLRSEEHDFGEARVLWDSLVELMARRAPTGGIRAQPVLAWAAVSESQTEKMRAYRANRPEAYPGLQAQLDSTLLHAAKMGNVIAVSRLAGAGASPSVRQGNGYSALHWAAHGGHHLMVGNLIRHGVAVDITDTNGRTALHVAARFGRTPVAEELLRAGADVAARDEAGRTPLHYCFESRRPQVETAYRLIRAGADPDATMYDEREGVAGPSVHDMATGKISETMAALAEQVRASTAYPTSGPEPAGYPLRKGMPEQARDEMPVQVPASRVGGSLDGAGIARTVPPVPAETLPAFPAGDAAARDFPVSRSTSLAPTPRVPEPPSRSPSR
jgi:hypothetical protein